MNKITTLFLSLCLFNVTYAQQLSWVNVTTSTGSQIGSSAATLRDDGYTIVTGDIALSGNGADFDYGSGVAILQPSGGNSGYVACYDVNGNYSWAFNLGSASGSLLIRDVTSDNSNSVYITGTIEQTQNVDFDPGPGTAFLTSYNLGNTLFAAKYDAQGNYQWAFALGSSVSGGYGNSIDVTPTGEVLIAGSILSDWNGLMNLNPLGNVQNVSTGGQEVAFIGWYTAQGIYIRHTCAGNTAATRYRCARANAAGDVFAAGETLNLIGLQINVDFDPGPGTALINQPPNQLNTFLVSFSATGNFHWLNDFSGQGQKYNIHVAPDNSGNVILGAMFMGNSLDFDSGPGVQTISGNNNQFTAVLAKYDNNGNFIWAFGLMGATMSSIYVNQQNSIYSTGFFYNNLQMCDFDPGSGVANLATQGTYSAKYDSLGNYRGAFSIGAISSGNTRPSEILVGNQDDVTLTGIYDQTVDFDPSNGNTIITPSNGFNNMFVARYDLKTTLSPELNASTIDLFPNPFTDILTLNIENIQQPVRIQLFNTTGQLVAEKTSAGSIIRMEETISLPAGIYYVNIFSEEKRIYTEKIIKAL